jgi:hypothetical protein
MMPIDFAFPLLGRRSPREACAPYAAPVNRFFLGGVMIAAAVFGISTGGAPAWAH